MSRYISPLVADDLPQKMIFITGPRQVGKTTMARDLGAHFANPLYLNYDAITDKPTIEAASWLPSLDYVVLDEIHSMPDWKRYLKGVFDGKPATQALLVTGSARLDTFRQSGESLAGRYFRWHLMPLSVRELLPHYGGTGLAAQKALDALTVLGGFPEPHFKGSLQARRRWENQYFNELVREDVLAFSRLHEIKTMQMLVQMLRLRTGSPLSFDSLGRDLGLSSKTVASYIDVLEALHIVFLIRPFHHNIARAQTKMPKLYFYDWAYIQGDAGARLENLTATHLLKHVHFLNDSEGEQLELNYVRTSTGHEIDFVITRRDVQAEGDPVRFIEVKASDEKPSYVLQKLAAQYPQAQAQQVVGLAKNAYLNQGVTIYPAAQWLAELAA